MESDSDSDLVEALDEFEQIGGAAPGRFVFERLPVVERRSVRLGVRERVFQLRPRQIGAFIPRQRLNDALVQGLRTALDDLINDQDIPDGDRIYIALASNRIANAYNGWGLRAGEWCAQGPRVDALLGNLSHMLNSNEQFEMDDSFTLSFVHVRGAPTGSGYKRKHLPGHQASTRLREFKHSVLRVPQDDQNLCCPRAIALARGVHQHRDDPTRRRQWTRCRGNHRRITRAAQDLLEEVGLPPQPCGPEQLQQLVTAPSLEDYTLVVVDANRAYACFAYGRGDTLLGLLHEDGHYDALSSLPGFFGQDYFCSQCFQAYKNLGQHACRNNRTHHCGACLQNGCPDYTEAYRQYRSAQTPCILCGRSFYGDTCLQTHRSKTHAGKPADAEHPSVCATRRQCKECHHTLRGVKEIRAHRCGYRKCSCCKNDVDVHTHRCFLQVEKTPAEERRLIRQRLSFQRILNQGLAPLLENDAAGLHAFLAGDNEDDDEEEDDEEPPLHVFFDIESMQVEGRHVPNLVVAETEDDDDPPVSFQGDDCLFHFLEWLETLTENGTRPLTVIAHNFKGYDSYPVIDELHRQKRNLEQIRNGGKVLQLTYPHEDTTIRFIDSLSFFQMPLSDFPKTFGLTELKKGYFPHLFNTPEHQTYVGRLPDKAFYMPDGMSVKKRRDFDTWYDDQAAREVVFDFQAELLAYCQSDVKLLKQGCLTFMRDFQGRAEFNPFEQMTVASACNRYLRMHCMEEDSIASEPLLGWRGRINHSQASMEWLTWCEHHLRQRAYLALSPEEHENHEAMAHAYGQYDAHHPLHRQRIQHARNEGEYRIPGTRYTVDGYDADTKTVYEFCGCFWHGCRTCHPQRTDVHPTLLDRTMDEVRALVDKKRTFLINRGYQVVTMWECTWNTLKQTNQDIKDFLARQHLQAPLEPRDAFYGGRTNAVRLYAHVDEEKEEEIRYDDYTSLYPWVNKYGTYPLGHPTFLYEPDTTDLSPYFGLAKCTVLPPQRLYHPVLPYRSHDKLTFPLCRTCVEENISKPLLEKTHACHHTDEERVLVGTWCTPELAMAVQKGYVIQHVHEVWHFDQQRTGLFQSYVDTWLQIKEEASGWPEGCTTPAQKQAHIDAYYAREGIRLDPAKIEKNPGLRALAKMMLNSMWGKFGQRINKTQVREFTEPQPFIQFLDSDQHDVRYVSSLTEDRVEVHYKLQTHDVLPSPNLNIFIAAFTTCHARLRLYQALDHLGERVLYFDTDSVIYLHRPDDPPLDPPRGAYLGDFKSELDADDHIVEFCSGGPKNYGYKTKNGYVECKVRGFSLNVEGMTQLNYEVLRQNTLDELHRPLDRPRTTRVTQSHTIQRNAKTYTLETQPSHKDYRLVYSKRVLDPNTAQTYPYGYERFTDEDLDLAQVLADLFA
ncbi:uncharacterized protein [Montipora capricornis]|uniref:uncharacterized protein n=1 Tax=Montipora capricornis TaxID=246305 RepID=UPI0035F1FA6B